MKNKAAQDIIKAHKFSINHKKEIMKDQLCGCFYCLATFKPELIEEWIEDQTGTAICPFCGIDSVLGESSGFPITKEFLQKMRTHWFYPLDN